MIEPDDVPGLEAKLVNSHVVVVHVELGCELGGLITSIDLEYDLIITMFEGRHIDVDEELGLVRAEGNVILHIEGVQVRN